MCANIIAFLPTFAEENNWLIINGTSTAIYETDVGLIVASFSLAQVVFSPVVSRVKNKIGAKNTMLGGLLLVFVSTTCLGLIAHVKHGVWFKYMAVGFRFL